MGSNPSAWKILSRPCPLCASRTPRQTSGLPAGAEPSFETKVIIVSTNSRYPAAFEEYQEKGLHLEYQPHSNTSRIHTNMIRMNAGIRYPEGRIAGPLGTSGTRSRGCRSAGVPCREIAREPSRSPSTASAEIPSRPPMKRGFPRRRRIRTPPQRNPRTRISTCEPVCTLACVFRSC